MSWTKARVQLATVVVALVGSATALGDTVVQTLDSVKVHSKTSVLNMNFDDPTEPDFTNSNINGTNYRACKYSGFGLYCLDGDLVRRTPNIMNPASTFTAIDCKDPGLNLDTNKGTPCTALTVDLTGTVWLGGKNKGKAHSIFKAVPNPNPLSPCISGVGIQGNTYCATEEATGRPLLVDLSSVDGDSATTFVHGAGVLFLEERKTAMFLKSTGGAPIEIASGKNGWDLIGNEQLISATAIQVEDINEVPFSYVLVTTTKDRVLAKRANGMGPAIPVFDIAANRGPAPPALCPPGDAEYGIRSSGKTGTIYLTDRQYCTVKALQANPNANGSLSANSLTVVDTLSTIDTVGGQGTHSPVAPTVSPGINIDLRDCGFDPPDSNNAIICTLVVDAMGNPAATLEGVRRASLESGLTLYQVKNIPDCRYVPQTCVDLLEGINSPAELFPDIVWDPDNTGMPQAQLLNVTKLLPKEVTDQFLLSGGLPDMWLPRQYRGQKSNINPFVFEAFFGVTEDGVIFRDTFEGVFNVGALAGSSLGCVPINPGTLPSPTPLNVLLAWDVINTVSEQYPTFDDPFLPGGRERISTIINSGCGSSKSIDTRWSLKPYNLEITPCTYNPNPNDVWASDGACPVGGPEVIDDAVFAKLLLGLFDDFKLALDQLACADADGGGSQPIGEPTCATLRANWINAKDKLEKCWDATQQPKQSAGAQNCTAFVSQLNGLESTLNSVVAPPPPLDPANRIGELKSRLKVIRHIRQDRFTPSIPVDGFVEPQP